jgi:septal ring factor EnvC (AmiA/AmiB activator)
LKLLRKYLLPGLLSALAGALLLTAVPACANKAAERNRQKRAAETEHAELQQKLDALKREITRTESAKGHAADALAQSEQAISEANRSLHELVVEQRGVETRLARLSEQQQQLAQAIAAQRKRLAGLLHGQYMAGNEDRMKLLLSGDNPNRINRELQYMGYVSQAQARLIASLQANMAAIESNQAATREAKEELDEIMQEQQQKSAQLEQDKARRSSLLAKLSNKLVAQRKEVGNIERDAQRLAALVDRLGKLIEEQRKAEAAAQEKRRQEQLARAKAKSEAAAKMRSRKTKPVNPDAIDDDEAPKTLARNELTPAPTVQGVDSRQGFDALRGRLRLPVRGELIAKFGGKRSDGPAWKGLFIKAAEGAEVKAVAAGQVIFAEWLRGFGNLVIVDHGDQYMTIYGNNQAVLKRVGDSVKTGDTIASAGNSGGNEQSGLYFEMRHQGRAIDPLGWITTR